MGKRKASPRLLTNVKQASSQAAMNWLALTQSFRNTCGTFELKALFNAASSLDIWFHWVRSGILVPIYETIDPAVLTSNDAPPRPIFHPRSSENFISSLASFIFSSSTSRLPCTKVDIRGVRKHPFALGIATEVKIKILKIKIKIKIKTDWTGKYSA